MAKRLTNKQKAFVIEYVQCFNATKAAKLAGYSKKTARQMGSENLSKPDIQKEIDKEFDKRALRMNEILARWTEQATASVGDFIIVNPDGDRIAFDPEMVKEMGHLIKRIKARTTVRYTEKGDQLEYTSLDLALHDAQKALDVLGRHRGIASEKVEHVGEVVLKVIRDGDSDASDN